MSQPKPLIIAHIEHNVSIEAISANALKVLYRLNQQGFSAYLVGGGVRDILLDKIPKDFDIATDARPEQIKKIFRNCLLIGRRFRLAHVRFGADTIEVSTFRASEHRKGGKHRLLSRGGMLLRDNVYGSLDEDAWRRDFSINALYYNIQDGSLVDYCGGLADLSQKCIRIIGDPLLRYREDPVRLLRAVRFAAKLGFKLSPETEKMLIQQKALLSQVPAARLFEEILKLFHSGHAVESLNLLQQYDLLALLFPQTAVLLGKDKSVDYWLSTACNNTDSRLQNQKTTSAAFLFAVFLWQPLEAETQRYIAHHPTASYRTAYLQAASRVLSAQHKHTTIPRFCSHLIREIWIFQLDLVRRNPGSIKRLLQHPRFRASYDFLLLRAQCQMLPIEVADWWTTLVESTPERQGQLIQEWMLKEEKAASRKRSARKNNLKQLG